MAFVRKDTNSDYSQLSYALAKFANALSEGADFNQAAEICDHEGTSLSVVREDASGVLLEYRWNDSDLVVINHAP